MKEYYDGKYRCRNTVAAVPTQDCDALQLPHTGCHRPEHHYVKAYRTDLSLCQYKSGMCKLQHNIELYNTKCTRNVRNFKNPHLHGTVLL
jgi:hypothetical protein